MDMSYFVDYAKVWCESGKGGDGLVHFRREKFKPKGGPDGGSGGRGGNVIVKGYAGLNSLIHLKYNKHFKAEPGQKGGVNNRTGAAGKDVIIKVPPGTVIKDAETGEVVAEILEDGQEVILLRGGKGGRGNYEFRSPTNQAPRVAEPGEPGIGKWFIFELKTMADVGIVGFPNAGKSTLISRISAAKPKVADYPFTTLEPHPGVVRLDHAKSFIITDIPGIIEGAHKGKGLGHKFLRHIERSGSLLFLLAPDLGDIEYQWKTLRNELKQYDPSLLERPYLIAISKADILSPEERREITQKLKDKKNILFISSVTGEGIDELKWRLWELVQKSRNMMQNS